MASQLQLLSRGLRQQPPLRCLPMLPALSSSSNCQLRGRCTPALGQTFQLRPSQLLLVSRESPQARQHEGGASMLMCIQRRLHTTVIASTLFVRYFATALLST